MDVELHEIRVFLALAVELHFGRTAERLGLTTSRVSQVLSALERKLGGELLRRTSRKASLTPLGEQFLTDVEPHYQDLLTSLEHLRGASKNVAGTLRLGMLGANSGGPHLTTVIKRFEQLYPQCEVVLLDLVFSDHLGPLRRGDVDVMATRLPINQPDVTIGPTLSREPRVLAVADDHPFAGRTHVTMEDLGDCMFAPIPVEPPELLHEVVPQHTPSGRPLRRRPERPRTPHEVTALVARGLIVHPTVPSFAQYFGHPGVTYVPITDMPPLKAALVWRRGNNDRRLREFIEVARVTLARRRKDDRE